MVRSQTSGHRPNALTTTPNGEGLNLYKPTLKSRAWWSVVGAATAATTLVAGLAPVAQAAPAVNARESSNRPDMAAPSDGTYESCGAYFGYGKQADNVLDVVDFDVSDQNGADGVHHAVGTDTQVVLVLTNSDGGTLQCIPQEVTEAEWNDAMSNLYISMPPGKSLPAWPGPGHYVYPSVNYHPVIENFGTVTDVGFKVTSIPGGHSLVSPTAVKPLAVHYPLGWDNWSVDIDPAVSDLVASDVGSAPAAALNAAGATCEADEDLVVNADLLSAINSLLSFRGEDVVPAENVTCGTIGALNVEVSFLLSLNKTVTYTEPIVLALPEPPTTIPPTPTTPPTTMKPKPPAAAAATAVAATPTYTG